MQRRGLTVPGRAMGTHRIGWSTDARHDQPPSSPDPPAPPPLPPRSLGLAHQTCPRSSLSPAALIRKGPAAQGVPFIFTT